MTTAANITAARSQAELASAAAGRAYQALRDAWAKGETTMRELNDATRAYSEAQARAEAARKAYEALI